jgi:hypothetical protein
MANRIKRNAGIDNNSLNIGNWSIGLEGTGMGPSASTGFKNGIKIPAGGYAIYTDGPNVRIANNDAELVFIMNKLNANVLTAEAALMFAKTADILVLNDAFDGVSTDGLVAYMDAKYVTSFPKDGTTWYSLTDSTKGLSNIRVLGYCHNYGAAKIYDYLAANTQFTSLGDYSTGYSPLQNLNIANTAANYDLVVVESAAWAFGADVMQKIKDLVDAGVSVIANGNDNRTNVFVKTYDNNQGPISHDIIMEQDSLIGLSGQTFPYGSGDVYGGIIELQNGAIPLYRRVDTNRIMGFVYHNEEAGASLFFDQEWHNNYTNDIYVAALNYVIKNIGYSGKFISSPVFDNATKSFIFDQNNEYFNLSTTAVENLSGSFTLMGFCKQGNTGAPHQTVIGTATGYRNGAKLMSRYHGQAAFWVGNNDGTDSYLLGSGVDITNDGQWHHLAATRDSNTGEIKVYVDGELKNNATYVTGALAMEGPATIGVDYHSAGYYHTGNIASVKAYNRVLSADEIRKDYYGSNLVTTSTPRLVIDPANQKSFTVGAAGLNDLAVGGDQFIIEGNGSKIDENGGILRLDEGRIYRNQVGWYGKMSMSWWMRYHGTPKNLNFYTESYRGSGGCARIYSPILADGRFQFTVWDNSSIANFGRGSFSAETTTNVCDGDWHHITCQWSNGTGNKSRGIYVYVNGVLEGYSEMTGNDGGYQHIHLGGVTGCMGEATHNVDFGPIIHYKNYNLSDNEVYQNYSAHAARFK